MPLEPLNLEPLDRLSSPSARYGFMSWNPEKGCIGRATQPVQYVSALLYLSGGCRIEYTGLIAALL